MQRCLFCNLCTIGARWSVVEAINITLLKMRRKITFYKKQKPFQFSIELENGLLVETQRCVQLDSRAWKKYNDQHFKLKLIHGYSSSWKKEWVLFKKKCCKLFDPENGCTNFSVFIFTVSLKPLRHFSNILVGTYLPPSMDINEL